MPVQNHIWLTIGMYILGAVVLGVLTYLWLTYRLKKKQRDDARRNQAMAAKQQNNNTP